MELHKQHGKQWREANKGNIKKIKKENYIINRQRILEHQREYRQSIKKQILSHYSQGEPKCARCGFSDMSALCIDHVNGGGSKHRKEIGGENFYSWLVKRNYPGGFQVLCYNCNWLKRLIQQTPAQVKNEKKNRTTIAYFLRTKTLVFQNYSKKAIPVCSSCGNKDLRLLSIDHIAGKGTKERREVGYGSTFFIWLVKNKFPESYQVLCLNCQMIKRAKNNENGRILFPSAQSNNSILTKEEATEFMPVVQNG